MSFVVAYALAGAGTLLVVLWVMLYLRYSSQYDIMIAAIDKKQFFLPEIFFIGFGFMDMFKVNLKTEAGRKKEKKIAEIYGEKYAEYYHNCIVGGQITYALTVAPLGLFIGAMTNDMTFAILVVAAAAALIVYLDMEVSSAVERKHDEILSDYPEILSKLTLLVNITVSVTFAQEYTVTVTADKGGKVLLDGEAVTEKTYKEGTEVELSVAADDDYQIESIAIDGTQEDIADTASFTKKLTVDKDTTIAVKFIRVYTVTVTYDSQHGTVETDPAAQGGEVEAVLVKQGSTLTIKATPKENYRVSEVEIDGKAESFDDNRYVKDTPFTRDIKNITAPHTIKITFAPTLQTITVISGEHGKVKVEGSGKVNYNDSVDLTITPDDGYIIDTITVDEADVKANMRRTAEKSYQLHLTEVQRDTKVTVTFTECPQIGTKDLTALGGITWNSGNAIRRDGATFVFANDAAVQFSAAADETGSETGIKGIQLIFADGTTSGGYDAETASFTQPAAIRETKTIQAIRVFYGETEIRVAQLADPAEKLEGLKIVVDKKAPTPELALEAANTNGYYHKSFTATVKSIIDPDDYSGIRSVEYWVVKDRTETEQGTVTQREMLYTYTEGGDILQELGDCTFTVDAGKNNSDNVVIYVQVTDRAGNVYTTPPQAVKINSTSPTIEIKFGGEKPVNVVKENGTERGYYKDARTATVTITDRASTLDLDAVKFDIKDTAGKDVSDTATISVWGKDDTKIGRAHV